MTAEPVVKGTSLYKDAWRRLRMNRMALFGAGFVVLMVVACFLGPFVVRWVWGYGTRRGISR